MKKIQSKRLKMVLFCILLNVFICLYAISKSVDIEKLGMFIAFSNAPLYAYVAGESFRPSQTRKFDDDGEEI